MNLKLSFISFFFIICFQVFCQSNDTIASRNSLFIVPYAAYQQETSWLFGLTGGYYFKSNDLSQISSVSGSVSYTLLEQFIFNITPKLYSINKKWYLYSNLGFQNFADYYYGIGNKPTDLKQSYISKNFNLLLQPQYSITKEFFLGAMLTVNYESITTDSSFNNMKDEIFERYGMAGWNPFSQFNVGIVASYDSRDNQFYPSNGLFAKASITTSGTKMGSTYSTNDLIIDVRHYTPIFKNHVLALQAMYSGIFSRNEIPFQLLPTLGGREVFRGFRERMYRDNVLMILQTEYRLPLYKNLKASIFCSAGDVVNSKNYTINKLKIAYGGGLRYKLNDARVHLRFDIAKNNYGEKLQFYITASEAF